MPQEPTDGDDRADLLNLDPEAGTLDSRPTAAEQIAAQQMDPMSR